MAVRPTMVDVARRSGVSLKTVSRYVNEEPGVAPATAARVAAAVRDLGFQRNDLARSLRRGRTSQTLGILIEDFGNPFYAGVVRQVERVAAARGYLLLTSSSQQEPEDEPRLVEALLRRRVDALLLVSGAADHAHVAAAARGTPVVFVDRPPRGMAADAVLLDNAGGARQAVEHLLRHGHRRIAILGDPVERYTAAERLRGYREALGDAGIEVDPGLVRLGRHDTADAGRETRALLALPPARRPTAIFTGNNRHTVGAVRVLARAAVRPALVGFDDVELADLLAVPISVVRYDAGALGRHAAELAFARLDGDPRPPQHVVEATTLVARGSGEVPPPRGA